MKHLRPVVIVLLVAHAALTTWGLIETHRTSQHFIEPQPPAILAFGLLQLAVEFNLMLVPIVRGARASRILRGLAFVIVTLRLGLLLYLTPRYVPALQLWGLSVMSASLVVSYLAFGLAWLQLVRDHRAARSPGGDPPSP